MALTRVVAAGIAPTGTFELTNVNTTGIITSSSIVANTATFSGAVTADSLSVSGNVSIAGTLTYEDVTNIDSIGIITARSDILVGGNLNITGVSTFNGTTEVQDSSFKVTNSNASGQYLQVTQNTNSSLNLDKVGDGAFYIRGNNIYLQNDGTSETYAGFEADGKSYLNYNGSTKLETTGTGVTITGDARVTGILTVGTASVTIDGSQDFPTIRPTLDLNFAATKTLDRRITFTRDSIGTYTDEFGIIQTVPNNVPRFDHDPETGESLGLLIEESRTNYTYNSLNYSGSWDNNRGTFTGITTITSPDGTTDGVVLFTESTETGAHHIKAPENTPTETIADGTTVTSSIWVKKYGSKQYITFGINLKDDSYARTTVNLDTGAVSNTAANYTATSTAYPNGWYRITVTGDGGTGSGRTAPVNSLFLVENGSSNTSSYTGDGSSGVYVWGPQMEIGSFATSYIPTTDSSTVTRAVEYGHTSNMDFYNQSEGSVFSEVKLLHFGSTSGKIIWSFNQAGGFGEGIYYVNENGSNNINYSVQNGGSQFSGNNFTSNNFIKSTIGLKENSMINYFNGSLVGSEDTSGTIPNNISRLVIGNNAWGNSFGGSNGLNPGNCHIKSFAYYNKRLPNAQLQSLTRQ